MDWLAGLKEKIAKMSAADEPATSSLPTNPAELVAALEAMGLTLTVDDDGSHVGPPHLVTPDIRVALRVNRLEVLKIIRARERASRPMVFDTEPYDPSGQAIVTIDGLEPMLVDDASWEEARQFFAQWNEMHKDMYREYLTTGKAMRELQKAKHVRVKRGKKP